MPVVLKAPVRSNVSAPPATECLPALPRAYARVGSACAVVFCSGMKKRGKRVVLRSACAVCAVA